MTRLQVSPPLLCLLPGLALVPVVAEVTRSFHGGGVETWWHFLQGALHPSLDPALLQSLSSGLQVTVATALMGWGLSIVLGTLLGVISSDVVWTSFGLTSAPARILRMATALPRAVHELLWGLLLLQVVGLHPWVAIAAIAIPYGALVARVLRDQIDSIDRQTLNAILQCGAGAPAALLTALLPPVQPILLSYGGYRLECALRSATLLGVFGLGGIGTELKLTLQSLQFNEFWTGLWLLMALSVVLEQLLGLWRRSRQQQASQWNVVAFLLITLLSIAGGGWWVHSLFSDSTTTLQWMVPPLPSFAELQRASAELPWGTMLEQTLRTTLLAAGIAIGLPPLTLLLLPTSIAQKIWQVLWTVQRVLPPPLTLLMLLLVNLPSLSLAALALGLHNAGVMGRLLSEGLAQQSNSLQRAIEATGAGSRQAWLLGQLSPQSRAYLAYGAYRTDVILRETVVVGLVGGTGLGWMLIESLSSFHWAAVVLLIGVFAGLTLTGEAISNRLRQNWLQA